MIHGKKLTLLLIGFVVASPLAYAALSIRPGDMRAVLKDTQSAYVPGELLVKFKPSLTPEAQHQLLASVGDRPVTPTLGSSGYTLIKLGAERSMVNALASYRAMGDVEAVQPNYIYRAQAVPNDTAYRELWGLKNTGQTVTTGVPAAERVPGADMDLEPAWDHVTDCSAVLVAVIDSGINYTHQDLAGNMWDGSAQGFPHHGYDFVDDDNDPMAEANIHGTHVAGTIGAVGNNGSGITGVCWKASIMAVRVLNRVGQGTTANIIRSLNFAVTHGAKVVNMSLGGRAGVGDPAYEAEIINAKDHGVVVVAAAGNSGSDNDNPATPVLPCNFPQGNVICVAALDQAYNLPRFSNYGATSVDVGAPGVNIFSAVPGPGILDNLTGWTRTGGWREIACIFPDLGPVPMLVNPPGWCPASAPYANNANDVAYKNFPLLGGTGIVHATGHVAAFIDTERDFDFFGLAESPRGGDPFVTNPGSIGQISGSSGGSLQRLDFNLDGCLTATCTVGFRLRTDEAITGRGVAILRFEIRATQTNSPFFEAAEGTSMAAPHVAGLAAMVWAYNPNYTYTDVVDAVKFGGESIPALAGKTTTGRAANAMGSLQYIQPPAGLTASAAP